MENCLETIKDKLKEEGFKLTPQRRSIVETMIDSKGKHLSSEEIYDLVKQKCPEIGLATVYRTLQLLDEVGVVLKLNLDDGCTRYEVNVDDENHNHHHLICKKCMKVIEVKEDLLEVLEEKIEKSYNFKIYDHDLKFFGICSECK
ncbi:Fur family transcriptional regulator, ferric uptake regulator [Alkalithermobacter thermoalcaliphilus JW-YL-7 = DSM 7308]|uniref:Ferric uptake regulator, Fur family n=1 Tax=Alkalithermobacter thermoalcaliphilus JW-YL-7 = DSM 7308 TaxID=1121328 RepID=A0A150FSD2_CLOPD|nr:ferric uptake regulator, Fur family [[Clostridium] paradoxum JW-YL-7 = DSM 7308]SHK76370.1 Fur family transcriptional regulator, ferric uptake regulator [[Clostridium] paradoxum JW-YL-7 = DSM 7308]